MFPNDAVRKLRRARDGEQFGYEYLALSDQYRSLWAIKMSRTWGRARIFFDFPQKKLPFCTSGDRTREPVFAANMEISYVRLNE